MCKVCPLGSDGGGADDDDWNVINPRRGLTYIGLFVRNI